MKGQLSGAENAPNARRRALTAATIAGVAIAGFSATPAASLLNVDTAIAMRGDERLIAGCREYLEVFEQSDNHPSVHMVVIPPELDAEQDALIARLEVLRTQIDKTPAQSLAGMRFKALVIMTWLQDGRAPEPGSHEAVVLSFCTNMIEGGFA